MLGASGCAMDACRWIELDWVRLDYTRIRLDQIEHSGASFMNPPSVRAQVFSFAAALLASLRALLQLYQLYCVGGLVAACRGAFIYISFATALLALLQLYYSNAAEFAKRRRVHIYQLYQSFTSFTRALLQQRGCVCKVLSRMPFNYLNIQNFIYSKRAEAVAARNVVCLI